MQGFGPKWKDFPDYIIGITKEIWEERGIDTLQDSSCRILESNITSTVEIFFRVFAQGRAEASLVFNGSDSEAAYGFLSFLIGTQIIARVKGGEEAFLSASEVVIRALTA